MNPELPKLLHRWREGALTTEEMCALTTELAQPEARAALRRDWFLEAALPQALAASAVIVRRPQSTLATPYRAWMARWLTVFSPGEESDLVALRLWARASLAALALGLITASWLVWPQQEEIATETDSEPSYIAQLMLETQLPDSP